MAATNEIAMQGGAVPIGGLYESAPGTATDGKVVPFHVNSRGELVSGGQAASVSFEVTRPNESNPYIALDVFSTSASAGTNWTFSNCARYSGGAGYIVKAQIQTDLKTNTARYRIHLFNAAPTAVNDNAPYPTLYANAAIRVGTIDFPAMATEDSTTSTQATAIATPGVGNIPLFFVTNADAHLYGILETLDAFTPAAQQKITIKLGIDQF